MVRGSLSSAAQLVWPAFEYAVEYDRYAVEAGVEDGGPLRATRCPFEVAEVGTIGEDVDEHLFNQLLNSCEASAMFFYKRKGLG